jgi:hypothetical protein
MAFMTKAMSARGASTTVTAKLVRLVKEHGAFEHVVDNTYFVPLGPYAQGDDPDAVRQRMIGELGREDVLVGLSFVVPCLSFSHILFVQAVVKSTRPLILNCGLSVGLVDQLQQYAINEIMEGKFQQYLKLQTVYALKKHTVTDGPAPFPL